MQWIAVAPVTGVQSALPKGIATPYMLTERVQLIPRPDWLLEPEILNYLSYSDRTRLQRNVQYCVSFHYDSEDLGSLDPWWKGTESVTKQDTATERLHAVELALWLRRRSGWGFDHIFHANEVRNKWLIRQVTSGFRFSPLRQYKGVRITADDLSNSKQLLRQLESFNRPSTLRSVMQFTRRALMERGWALRFVT